MRPEITSGKIYGLELATSPGWRCPWGTVLGAGVCPLLVRPWWLAIGVGVNFCLLFLGTEGMTDLCPQSLLRGDRARAACSMLGSGGFEQSRAAQLPIAQGIAGTCVLCVRVGIKTLLGSLFLSLNNK